MMLNFTKTCIECGALIKRGIHCADHWKPETWTTYLGIRSSNGTAMVLTSAYGRASKALTLGLDVVNHSPTGFEWGYSGSGPAQLALAILLHAGVDKRKAVDVHQKFKEQVISALPRERWKMKSNEVLRWVEDGTPPEIE